MERMNYVKKEIHPQFHVPRINLQGMKVLITGLWLWQAVAHSTLWPYRPAARGSCWQSLFGLLVSNSLLSRNIPRTLTGFLHVTSFNSPASRSRSCRHHHPRLVDEDVHRESLSGSSYRSDPERKLGVCLVLSCSPVLPHESQGRDRTHPWKPQ